MKVLKGLRHLGLLQIRQHCPKTHHHHHQDQRLQSLLSLRLTYRSLQILSKRSEFDRSTPCIFVPENSQLSMWHLDKLAESKIAPLSLQLAIREPEKSAPVISAPVRFAGSRNVRCKFACRRIASLKLTPWQRTSRYNLSKAPRIDALQSFCEIGILVILSS